MEGFIPHNRLRAVCTKISSNSGLNMVMYISKCFVHIRPGLIQCDIFTVQ